MMTIMIAMRWKFWY